MPSSSPYQPLPNTFRTSLRERKRLIGCWMSLASPIVTELVGVVGFDWMLLDAEHAPNDALTLIPQLMALKDSPSAPVVRPQANDPVAIKKLLDGGVVNFLIPFVDSAADADAPIGLPDSSSASVALGVSTVASGTTVSAYSATNSLGTYKRPSSPSTGSHTYDRDGLAARNAPMKIA